MSLGLPGHVASQVLNEGIARGTRTVAAIALGGALAVHILLNAATPSPAAMPTLVALVATAASLALLLRNPVSTGAAAAFLAVGAAAVAASSLSVFAAPTEWIAPAASVVHLVGLAMVMVGGVATTRGSGLRWTGLALGAVFGVYGVMAVVLQTDVLVPWLPGGGAVVVGVIYLVTGSQRGRRLRLAQPDIHRAARDEKVAEVRSRVEMRAAALLHDTILGSLTAIANGPLGPIRPSLAQAVEADLDRILGQDWIEAARPVEKPAIDRVLAGVVDEVKQLGLEVDLTGDVETLERLSPTASGALALAVKQLLVNVVHHAGVSSAEVVVVGYPDSLSVMVIDDGVGFSPDAVGPDRIGLRTSVVDRVEHLGGSVRLFSTPGRGTSVLVWLPVEEPETLLAEVAGEARGSDEGRPPARRVEARR